MTEVAVPWEYVTSVTAVAEPAELCWIWVTSIASLSASLSVCEPELVSIISPECSPFASKDPETFAFELFATVKVASSFTTPTSFCATGSVLDGVPLTNILKKSPWLPFLTPVFKLFWFDEIAIQSSSFTSLP